LYHPTNQFSLSNPVSPNELVFVAESWVGSKSVFVDEFCVINELVLLLNLANQFSLTNSRSSNKVIFTDDFCVTSEPVFADDFYVTSDPVFTNDFLWQQQLNSLTNYSSEMI
jgi:hypothetical protein